MLIDIQLDKDFENYFNFLSNKYGEEVLDLNGFSGERMNLTSFIDGFIDSSNTANASIDPSANVFQKDICSMESEMSKPHSKLLAFNKIFYEIKKARGLEKAQHWLENEWNGAFYLHDAASSTSKPYCYAYDLTQLAEKGLYFIENFAGGAPKHLTTFTDFVAEFTSYASNRSSGAVGLPDFLIWSYYFWKKDVENGYYVKSPLYYQQQEFQRVIFKLNQPYLRKDQSAFTNMSLFDRPYLEAIFGGREFPDGTFVIDEIEEIMEYQKSFMEVCSDIRSHNMMTFPVLTFSLLYQDNQFVDQEFAKWACKHNMKWNDSNFYCSDKVTSLSNCCRLLSDIEDSYFNSIGGTALEVGSVKVNTINLARIAYESEGNIDDYLDILCERVIECLDTLDTVRHIITRNIEKGLLPNYTQGLISLENQYNTIGINGIYETLKFFNMTLEDEFGNVSYTDAGVEFAEDILGMINEVKSNYIAKKDYKGNIEQVPAERCAAILKQKDMMLYPDEVIDEMPLYGNQWIPLGVKSTLFEKISLSAILDKACSGGSIAHLNLEAPLTDFNEAWRLLNYIASEGVTYFAFCTRINTCEHNHAFFGKTCSTCGGAVKTTWTRIVGFLTPISSYSKERAGEFKLRHWLSKGDLM